MANKILIYGIGNDSRQDDGLGIRFIEELEKLKLPENIHLDSCYQLNVEDALTIAAYDKVYFVDASHKTLENGFCITPLNPSREISFSTHAMKPESILAFALEFYQKKPETYMIGIQGYEWELGVRISARAQRHFDECFKKISGALLGDQESVHA